ncbi:uncharacterized protein PG998_002347 [Apiospora kogelbergensis]|uniref:Uncharacterized protein n=1 Tax=Apiospora kogelbergensis TaxID=1337665 RepID=A0AAW0Q503_9PEZI
MLWYSGMFKVHIKRASTGDGARRWAMLLLIAMLQSGLRVTETPDQLSNGQRSSVIGLTLPENMEFLLLLLFP